ncbi:MAG TPA: S8/S53 family peptidase [Flavobacteriaceae bacterium]
MKVTVIKYLNVRVGKPSVNAPCYQYLAPGSELEVDGILYPGDLHKGIDAWYKDEAGNYYWSGGIKSGQNNLEQDISLQKTIDFRNLIKLKNFTFRKIDPQNPSNVKIAVLDSGIFIEHPDFDNQNKFLLNSKKEPIESDPNYIDEFGHGTKVSGIIGGCNNDDVGIIGVCPDCSILSIKVLNNIGNTNSVLAKNGIIELMKHPDIKIANLSFSLPINAYSKISQLFTDLTTTKLLIAAAGNEEILNSGIRNPARNSEIISVGSLPISEILNPNLNVPNELDYILPKLSVISTSNNPFKLYEECIGSSFSSAIVTGIVAELKASGTNIINKQTTIQSLNKHCYSLIEFRQEFKNLNNYENGLPIIKTK